MRLTPMGGPGGSFDEDPLATYAAAAARIGGKGLAYLHVVRPNSHGGGGERDGYSEEVVAAMRGAFDGPLIVNGGFSPEEAAAWVAGDKADAIAFGRLFLANPDLPARIARGGPYNEPDQATFYGGGAHGYVDYPTLAKLDDALPTS